MHKLASIGTLAVPILAAGQNGGQATVISGHASNRMQVSEVTAPAGLPLVNTPSATLVATPLSAPNGGVDTFTWYGPGTASEVPEEPNEALTPPQNGNFMNVGVGTSQDSKDVAQLMFEQQVNRQVAGRLYTNRDVAQLVQQLNQSTGLVKYGDKSGHLY